MKAVWETKKLSDFSAAVSTGPFGSMLHKSDYVNSGVPLVNPINIINDCIVPDPNKLIDLSTKDRLSNYILREGDVVVARRGEIGRCAVVSPDESGWLCGTGCFFIRPLPSLNPKFLAHLIRSDDYRKKLEAASTGATMKSLSNTALADLLITIPPASEQQRIVAILDEAFEGIATAKANAERNLQNAKAIFEEHLRAVFANRGGAWAEKRLGDLCSRVSVGHVGPTSRYYCDTGSGIPFLRSQNVRPGRIDFDGLQYITPEFHRKLRKSILQSGDLLFVRVGANRGDCCVVPEGVGELNCANIVFARPEAELSEFVALYCRSEIGRQRLLGMTTGAAQGVINTGSVAELMIPLPNSNERKQITAQLDALASESQRVKVLYERKLAALDDLKKSLLHHAFSGQL